MDTQIPSTVQNENLQIHTGKSVNRANANVMRPEYKMATQIPSLVQNENLRIHKGKGISGVKADVMESENRACKDQSFGASKGPVLQVKPSVCDSPTTMKCHDWDNEENWRPQIFLDMSDMIAEKELQSLLKRYGWRTQMTNDLGMPTKEAFKEIGDTTYFKPEPEPEPVLTPNVASFSGDSEETEDPFGVNDLHLHLPVPDFQPYKLKESPDLRKPISLLILEQRLLLVGQF